MTTSVDIDGQCYRSDGYTTTGLDIQLIKHSMFLCLCGSTLPKKSQKV